MKLGLLALCEGAFNHNGHLTIVNTLDFFNVQDFPYKVSQLGLAVKIHLTPEDAGEHQFKILCQDPLQKNIVEIETPKLNNDIQEDGVFCITTNLNGFLFAQPGDYRFIVLADNNPLGDQVIKVKAKNDHE